MLQNAYPKSVKSGGEECNNLASKFLPADTITDFIVFNEEDRIPKFLLLNENFAKLEMSSRYFWEENSILTKEIH